MLNPKRLAVLAIHSLVFVRFERVNDRQILRQRQYLFGWAMSVFSISGTQTGLPPGAQKARQQGEC